MTWEGCSDKKRKRSEPKVKLKSKLVKPYPWKFARKLAQAFDNYTELSALADEFASCLQ